MAVESEFVAVDVEDYRGDVDGDGFPEDVCSCDVAFGDFVDVDVEVGECAFDLQSFVVVGDFDVLADVAGCDVECVHGWLLV